MAGISHVSHVHFSEGFLKRCLDTYLPMCSGWPVPASKYVASRSDDQLAARGVWYQVSGAGLCRHQQHHIKLFIIEGACHSPAERVCNLWIMYPGCNLRGSSFYPLREIHLYFNSCSLNLTSAYLFYPEVRSVGVLVSLPERDRKILQIPAWAVFEN